MDKSLAEKILVPFDKIPEDPQEIATLIRETPLLHKLPLKYVDSFTHDFLYYNEADSQTFIAHTVTTALLATCYPNPSISTLCELLIQNPVAMFDDQVKSYTNTSPRSERPKFDDLCGTVRTRRPSFMYWIGNTLLLKGEEEVDFPKNDRDLTNRYRATSAGAPFMICYIAGRWDIQFFVLDRHNHLYKIYEFYFYDDPCKFLKITINIARVMVSVAKQLRPDSITFPLGQRLQFKETWITFLDDLVIKHVPSFDDIFDFDALKEMYSHASGHRGLVQMEEMPYMTSDGTYVLTMKTRGIEAKPHNEDELRAVMVCILEGLCWLHNGGFVHRNIHWKNIMRVKGDEYVLIDFEHGGYANESLRFSNYRWDRNTLTSNKYTCASDMYELKNLIKGDDAERLGLVECVKSQAGLDFWKNLQNPMHSKRMTAAQALKHPWIKIAALEEPKKKEQKWLESYGEEDSD
ncbi:hypothetical protein BC937DRAFT_90936 [Endogone sp. FLAS-F59071]|nr:hypothetical protein BC937DRAFT_90936 [Endogone sp. FLAS-F59071]|eukprot:RUS16676.1 hypothetical protein BC937DRAFT_90936 [Endogone sp. FLAS-F59071]